MRFTLLLLLASFAASAQSGWRVQLLDSSGFAPTAMGTVENLVAIASQPEGSTFFPRTGDLRLRIHPVNNLSSTLLAPIASVQFPGEFVANHILGMGNLAVSRFLIAGGFHDTCYLPNDTLIGFEPLALDPFLMRVNAQTGQPEWVWHRRQAQNNYIHKINYEAGQGTILASGLYDDVSGWLAAFNASNGQLLWEKAWTGARTVSDACFDPDFPGAVLFTGTIDDFGHLNNIPTPLTPLPNTGYRTFLARYWPANDSVQFIATTPYITFDFEPSLVVDNAVPLRTSTSWQRYFWSTPSIANGQQYILYTIGGFWSNDTLQVQQMHGQFAADVQQIGAGPVLLYQAPNAPHQSHVIRWLRGSAWPDTLFLANSSEPGRVGAVGGFGSNYYLTVKASGAVRLKCEWGNCDTTFAIPGASPFTPRWIILHRKINYVGLPEVKNLPYSVYPNPVQGRELFIQLAQPTSETILWQLHDLQGRRLASGSLAADDNRIQLPALATGMYLLEVQQGEKRGWNRVVVK